MKQKVSAKTNLISLLDNTYPGVNKLFDSPVREDGSEKWGDYAYSFWHVDRVLKIGLKVFTERFESFCKKHHYNFQKGKPAELFEASKQLVAVFHKEKSYKLLIQQLNLASEHIEILRKEMNELASTLLECSMAIVANRTPSFLCFCLDNITKILLKTYLYSPLKMR